MGKPKIALPLSNMLPSVLSTGMKRPVLLRPFHVFSRSQDARRYCINTCICATMQGSGGDADWTYVNEVPAGAVAGSQLSEIESSWYLKAAYQRVHLN